MATTTQALFSIANWDENTWDGQPAKAAAGARLTHAVVAYNYSGGISGTSRMQYLMSYNTDGVTGSYVALEAISGRLDGRAGSFALLHSGTFDAQSISAAVSVVPGSGTGELAGLRGTGAIHLRGHQNSYPFSFEYDFEAERAYSQRKLYAPSKFCV